MNEPTFIVRLTRRELWSLWQNFEAAFTDPNEMDTVDRSARDKVSDAYEKSH